MFGWPVPSVPPMPPIPNEPAALLAGAIGLVIALRLRARLAAFFIVGNAAWRVSFLIRNVYGIQWANLDAQFAAMVTGMVGVVLGALLVRYARLSKDSWAVTVQEQTPSPGRLILGRLLKPDIRSVQVAQRG